MATTIFSVPGISCAACKNRIEAALAQAAGVDAATVDVSAKSVTVRHDADVGAEQLIGLIESQGYDVAGRH
ncbi:heavy metal-associated domain-containing protein [Mycobacterium sp.]|uniref:heavy-metal-associated domain-containing protein n=1 Tax=Mycobacterium sp. TaxID=1785 RepID=UPI0031E14892